MEAGIPNSYGFEHMTLSQTLYVAKRISEVFEPALSTSERKFQVREIALILSPNVMLIDEGCYLEGQFTVPTDISELPIKHFISLTPQQVDVIADLMMWYGQYNQVTVDAKHVFCVNDLNSGRCIVFQRSRWY